ncbi:MAG: hypothetical protein R2940_10260 [Syntrophotaleaceae bacterium]
MPQVRKRHNLETGTQFVVIGEDDVVILKVISPPSLKEFDALIVKARRDAKAAGLKQAETGETIAKARGRK